MLTRLGHTLAAYARKNTFIREKLKVMVQPHITAAMNTSIPEIIPINARRSDHFGPRMNILVPSINQAHVFGGISTALSFFELTAKEAGVQKRIITTDTMPDPEAAERFSDYVIMPFSQDSFYDNQIVGFGDRAGKTIPVGENDYFMATAWWTAFNARKLVHWQRRAFGGSIRKMLYFIQDFEPGFYPWSSRFALAESTYCNDHPQVAVFNSSLLHRFFRENGYFFENEFVFEPVLGHKLKEKVKDVRAIAKKKQILVYGRPSVERNAFSLIIEALRAWVWTQHDVHDWTVISAGEKHPDIDLGNDMTLKSLGKLSLDKYSEILKDSGLGISLMISPHPSYPPMEMAVFGMGVISNTYASKDLSDWHENIHSIDLSVDSLVLELTDICGRFAADPVCFLGGKLKKKEYMDTEDQFYFLKDLVFSLFNRSVQLKA
jgi:O-antigen biosynthesis protein